MACASVVGVEAVTAAFDALEAALDAVARCDVEGLATTERFVLWKRCERVRRRMPALEHPLINALAGRPRRKSWAASWPIPSPSGPGSAAPRRPGGCGRRPICGRGAR